MNVHKQSVDKKNILIQTLNDLKNCWSNNVQHLMPLCLFHVQEALGGLSPHLRASKRRTGCQCCRCCEQRTKSKSQSVILYWIQNQPEHEGMEDIL